MRLRGHHALVTGGGTGIGAAIARALAEEGARVSIVGRRLDKLKETAQALAALGFEHIGYQTTDVTDPDRVYGALRAAHQWNGGRITILVNNAGAAASAPFAKVTEESWRETMAVNLDGAFHFCQAALPDLLQFGAGRIVNIASTAGLRGYPYTAAYVAAKHGVVGLTRALAAEFADRGLRVNAVCPGFTDTNLVTEAVAAIHQATGRTEARSRAELAAMNPSGRLIAPAEVAKAVLDIILSDRNGEAVEIS